MLLPRARYVYACCAATLMPPLLLLSSAAYFTLLMLFFTPPLDATLSSSSLLFHYCHDVSLMLYAFADYVDFHDTVFRFFATLAIRVYYATFTHHISMRCCATRIAPACLFRWRVSTPAARVQRASAMAYAILYAQRSMARCHFSVTPQHARHVVLMFEGYMSAYAIRARRTRC